MDPVSDLRVVLGLENEVWGAGGAWMDLCWGLFDTGGAFDGRSVIEAPSARGARTACKARRGELRGPGQRRGLDGLQRGSRG